MQCPSCGAEVKDPLAAFCPRCASPLADDTTATAQLEVPELQTETTDTRPEVPVTPSDAPGAQLDYDRPDEPDPEPEPLPPRLDALRERLEGTGWLDAIAAAGLGFLVLLAVGAVLVLAAKLNFPRLGGGADPLSAFNAAVMAGLGGLGVPIVIDGLAASALPFGALAVIGIGIVWAVRTSLGDRSFSTVKEAVVEGARVGVPFGLLCWFFALVFRVRGQHPVASDAGMALVAGAFWGALFGALGTISAMEPLRSALLRVTSGIKVKDRRWFDGAMSGVVMLAAAALLGAAATLLWVIVVLAKGAPGDHFGAGDAFAYVVYLVAFLPNIVVGLISLSIGAGIDVGAKIDVGGRMLGPLREYSLTAWGKGDPPTYLWLLILIPLIACMVGGLYARRKTIDPKAMVPVLLTASGVFAVTLTLLGAIGPVRMAGVLKGSGYALIAPDAAMVFILAFLVSGVVGFLGWTIGERTGLLDNRFPPTT